MQTAANATLLRMGGVISKKSKRRSEFDESAGANPSVKNREPCKRYVKIFPESEVLRLSF